MKKSQGGAGGIAVLIVLIALFMVLYLIFIPPADRERLLNPNQTDDDGSVNNGNVVAGTLLSQNPGLLKPFDKETSKHQIDSVQLYLKDEPQVEDLANSIVVSKSMFSTETKELRFNADDLTNLNKASLFFLVGEAKGELIIYLNGVEIFNRKARGLESTVLPLGLLKESNILLFRTSSSSLFVKNIYALSEIKLRKNFELTNTKEKRNFVLTSSELGDSTLNFFAFCNKAPTGSRLRIFLNGKGIFDNLINCLSSEKTAEIKEDNLKQGDNELLFEIDRGDFLINDIVFETKLEEGGAKTYKFAVAEKQMDGILTNPNEVKLIINFKDDKEKRGTINLNGNEISLDTSELQYSSFITSYIREGNNFIRINPSNEFTIDLLEIKII